MACCRNRLGAGCLASIRAGFLFAVGLHPLGAQNGGVVDVLCSDGPTCTEDALEIVFESGTSTYTGPLEVGAEIPIEVVMDARSVIPGAAPLLVSFIRGDANGDSRINVLDALTLIRFVTGDEDAPDCAAALNANGDGGIDASDALSILRWVFLEAPPLPPPFPGCGYVPYGACSRQSPGC